VTYWTFLVGTLALAGVPGLAGFFSKDQILASAFGAHWALWAVGLLTAGLTACYMFRLLLMTFHGEFRGSDDELHHLHESPPVMIWPLRILALGAILIGYVGLPRLGNWDKNWFGHFLAPVLAPVESGGQHAAQHHASVLQELVLMGLSVGVAGAGIYLAWRFYGGTKALGVGERIVARFPALHRVLLNKYYIDEFYDATVVKGTWSTARRLLRFDVGFIDGFIVHGFRNVTVAMSFLSGFFDKYFVDGLVNLIGWVSRSGSRFFRSLQTGVVSQYAMVMAVGMFVLVFFFIVIRAGG
jgi:NADH-quinone oxidoreductase subunit L